MGDRHQDIILRRLNRSARMDLQQFGKDMRVLRALAYPDHSLRGVALLISLTPATLSLVERGHVYPSDRVLKKFEEFYMKDADGQALTMKRMKEWLPEAPRRGRPEGADPHRESWPEGQKLFAGLLRKWMVGHDLAEVALAGKISVIYLKQLRAGTHAVPPNAVCERLAVGLGKKPTKMLILRAVMQAHSSLRDQILESLWPDGAQKAKALREKVGSK